MKYYDEGSKTGEFEKDIAKNVGIETTFYMRPRGIAYGYD